MLTPFLREAALLLLTRTDAKAKGGTNESGGASESSSAGKKGGTKKGNYDPSQERGKDGRWVDTDGIDEKASETKSNKEVKILEVSDPIQIDWKNASTTPESRKKYIEDRFKTSDGWKYKNELEAIKNLKPKSKEVIQPEELAALRAYSGFDYENVNKTLRGNTDYGFTMGDSKEAIAQRKIEDAYVATAALNKLPAFKGTVYRGTKFKEADLYKATRAYKVGQTVTEQAFTSSSQSSDNKYWSGANVRYVINSKSGRNIESVSKFPDEKEVLFAPQTEFKIIKSSNEDGVLTFYLDEVVKRAKKK